MAWTPGSDAHAVVFDNGTSTTKIGYAPVNGADPVLVDSIPTLYGIPKELAAMESVADAKMERVGKGAMVSYCKVAINCVTN